MRSEKEIKKKIKEIMDENVDMNTTAEDIDDSIYGFWLGLKWVLEEK